ncbi:solute carrier family 3 member 2a isoform X1 [Xiphophorus couchianus]|uniref:solute carrier family 3 member 2a isoform X1 n=1 Tax=Xiphophorus couchianus TaxID=32473 RepID=UPI001016EA88|nr:4F2 cell-surface antigen heavy chain isoform X1 [Xiphophorus couchianus]
MNKDTEMDLEEVKLNTVDQEKQPIAGDGPSLAGEKNGSVKLKIPDEDVTFTGLSKEELMKVAGTPGWVRTRWVLLVLFWLGWVGMLAGAIVIIVQAPRCKPIPEMHWWNEGPLYQIPSLEDFSDGLKGLEGKLDQLNQLKVKGLVLGPFHAVQKDQANSLDLENILRNHGTEKELEAVLLKAKKKGISVVVDLTPNYEGANPWFSAIDDEVMEKVRKAAERWINLGVDGIKVSDLRSASSFNEWQSLRTVVQGNHTVGKARALIGAVEEASANEVVRLINTTGVDIILPNLLSSSDNGVARIKAVDVLHSQQSSVGWGLGASKLEPLSKAATSSDLQRLYHLLLFTLPGIPVFTYGDELGLQLNGTNWPKMVWETNASANQTESRTWFKSLSDLRGKERSLLHGDYYPLNSSATSLAFLRVWDQSERYITAVNWGEKPAEIKITLPPSEGVTLPDTAEVKMSTDENLAVQSSVSLEKFTIGPEKAVILQFPFTG